MTAIPRSKSAGGTNAYTMPCTRPTGSIAFYGLCQLILRAAADGRLKGHEDCVAKFKDRTCPALKMMREEQAAGHALYYEEYGILSRYREEIATPQRLTIIGDESPSEVHRESVRTIRSRPEVSKPKPVAAPTMVEFDPSKILATVV